MSHRIPVVIDTDPGVDDAVAIALAVASPEIELLGVTTVGGNVGIELTTRNALDVLAMAGRPDIPVAAGAARPFAVERSADAAVYHGGNGLGGVALQPSPSQPDPRGAVDLLVALIESSDRPVTVVAIGPLTNLAVLHAAHPATYSKIERIVMMGGGAHVLGNDSICAEFNIGYDPEGAARVFSAGVPIVMVGLDVTEKAVTYPRDLEPLRAAGPLATALARMIDFYMDRAAERLGERLSRLHDALAVAYLLDASLLDVQPYWVGVECAGTLTRGMTVVDVRHFTRREPNALVAVDVDRDRFVDLLVARLTAHSRACSEARP